MKSIFEKIPPACLNEPTSLYKGGCFPQKDGRRVRVSPNKFIYTKRKSTKEKSCAFLAQKERLDGFSTRRVRFANSLFYVPFAPQKDGRSEFSLSKQIHIYKKKKHKGKSLCFFCSRERLDGFPTRRVRFVNSLFYVLFCSAKDGRRVRVSYLFALYRKKVMGKPDTFLAQKERLDGLSTRRVRFANSLFLCPFCSAKDGRRVRVSPNKFHIYKRKSTKEKSCAFLAQKETRTLAPVTRPTPLAGGASSPT